MSDAQKIIEEMQKKGIRIEVGGSNFAPKRVIPSGSYLLDWMLGVGGLPSGRLIELAGDEGGGKTTLSMVCAASVKKYGLEVVWVDAEHSFDTVMADNIGAKDLIVVQPRYGEEALDVVRQFVTVPDVGLIVIDSVAALVSKAELETEYATDNVAAQARMLSLKLRQIFVNMMSDSPTILLINQVRDRIGGWGDTSTTPGGRSPKHWAHIRIKVAKSTPLKTSAGEQLGRFAKLSYLKSKMTSPDKSVEIPLIWGYGVDYKIDLLQAAVITNVIAKDEKTGRFYLQPDTPGKFLKDITKEQMTEIETKLRSALLPI